MSKRLFTEPYAKDGAMFVDKTTDLNQAERRQSSFDLPQPLETVRALLTKKDLVAIDYSLILPDVPYYSNPDKPSPICFQGSTAWLQSHGLLERLRAVAETLLNPAFEEKLCRDQKKGKNIKKVYQLGLTIQPTNKNHGVQLSAGSRSDTDNERQRVIFELSEIAAVVLTKAFPEHGDNAREVRYYCEASLTMGWERNHYLTNIQLNFSKPKNDLGAELGKFGGAHTDGRDDVAMKSVLFNLSNLEEDCFMGRTNLTPLRLTAEMKPLEVLVFSGRFYHRSTAVGPYTVPRDSPQRILADPLVPPFSENLSKLRLVVVLYPSQTLMEPKFWWLNPEIFTPAMLSVMTLKAHQEFMMRLYIKYEKEICARSNDCVAVEGDVAAEIVGNGPEKVHLASLTYTPERPTCRKDWVAISEDNARIRAMSSATQAGQASASEPQDGDNEVVENGADPQPESDTEQPPRKRARTKKSNSIVPIPPEIQAAIDIPHGTGLDLTDEQIISLDELRLKHQLERASAVFDHFGRVRSQWYHLPINRKNRRDKIEADAATWKPLEDAVVRNGDADHYVRLFAWKDTETGEIVFPDINMAVQALAGHGVKNGELDEIRERFRGLLPGTMSHTIKRPRGQEAGDTSREVEKIDVNWTHEDYVATFDPTIDEIPSNPVWNNHESLGV
ncbi:hypothetical protein G7Y89_g14013 [Cudoniella acicularis]|uniref:Uncharacterized protein n=1 Tax=Cudoniella acicularis TaxID=354080 RepID=A0A8H4VVG4_9HELO|nr:hypothetical protein G7Y89_g14013 [Cudoniella acicularis]